MKSGVRYCRYFFIALVTLLLWQPCYAMDPALERVGDFGNIDWVDQRVIAKGIGAPPQKYYGKPQARPLALRAAVTDARRNLLEVIKGVHIDSVTMVNNYMVRNDAIVAKVEGLVQNSSVDNTQYMSDGTVEVIVSMPLTGQLGETLIELAVQQSELAGETAPEKGLEGRLFRLEERVKALEDKLAGLKQISLEQQQMIELYRRLVTAWVEYMDSRPLMIQAGFDEKDNFSSIRKKVDDQESRIAALSAKLDQVAQRLSTLESSGAKPSPPVDTAKRKDTEGYTGLVIDARDTGFRPCLKPNIFAQGALVYPGEYIDRQTAVRKGFVRYYRQVGQAQKSTRVGGLPYTVQATGTWKGKRNLEVGSQAADTLNALREVPGNFLAECKVVIVF